MEVILGKFVISIVASLCIIILLYQKNKVKNYINQLGYNSVALFWLIFRVLPFVVIYVVLHKPTNSDVYFFYWISKFITEGKLIYRDFWMPYSPLFPYYNLIPIWIYDAKESIVAWMLVYELLAVIVTIALYKKTQEKNDLIYKILLYLALPASLGMSVLGSQEDVSLWLYVALALLVWQRTQSQFWVGVVLAIGLLFTKILLLFPIVAFFIFFKKPFNYLAGLAIVGIPSLVILYILVQDKILAPLKIGDYAFAPNLISIISPWVGGVSPSNKMLNNFGLMTLLIPMFGYSIKFRNKLDIQRFIPFVFCSIFLYMMVFHKSSIANYIYIMMLPILMNYTDSFTKKTWAILLLWNITAVVQPSIWYSIGSNFFNSVQQLSQPLFLIDYILEVIYVASTAYFAYFIYKKSTC